MSEPPIVGVLVGGASRRMGGIPKGMLLIDGEPIAGRLVRLVRARGLEVVLVGAGDAYDALSVPRIPDAAPNAGPLSGIVALLTHAAPRDVIALACDLPSMTAALLDRLATAGGTCAPRVDGRWEPLTARYASNALDVARARLAEGSHALQGLLDAVHARPLSVDTRECAALADCDSPWDLVRIRT